MNKNEELMKALQAVAPVAGFSPGISKDWDAFNVRIDFTDNATEEQRIAAYQVMQTFDVNAAPPVDEQRSMAYKAELGTQGDQNDAIQKGLTLLFTDLIDAGVLKPDTIKAFTPNPDARPDTPAGWLGKVQKIKQRYPKEVIDIGENSEEV